MRTEPVPVRENTRLCAATAPSSWIGTSCRVNCGVGQGFAPTNVSFTGIGAPVRASVTR